MLNCGIYAGTVILATGHGKYINVSAVNNKH